MKVALLQLLPRSAADSADPGWLEPVARNLAALGVEIMVVPELILPGYNRPEAHREQAQPVSGKWIQQVGAIARSAGLAITFGWAERSGDKVYNAASFIGADGSMRGHYRKKQLFGPMERESFQHGAETPPVFEYRGHRIGMLVCYDIEFPEHARVLARQGAEILVVPTANPAGYGHVNEFLVPARANENAVSILYANYIGADGDLTFGGGSLIVGPDGRALASAGKAEAILIADLPKRSEFAEAHLSTQLKELRD
ncbi:carbon-nitrogen hydrolase family protein [Paracoccus fistulariae]|uniref:Carbon-nitrogen hydrolase family protein n=1 Tax=Paracoccus fistulariae TaxID=658446 RepID=A0ABY7SME5_9RHOB|nr:carbon-nitrogen hydrolase family protein [Paracoccus fistulariae]MDB6182520.1 carbon-nitrogen hydrolase family protein [Paracoccus fistulariae]WCR07733.1 carbon-nitrogen hydrolase family protein [Paracoccus fistulariae]